MAKKPKAAALEYATDATSGKLIVKEGDGWRFATDAEIAAKAAADAPPQTAASFAPGAAAQPAATAQLPNEGGKPKMAEVSLHSPVATPAAAAVTVPLWLLRVALKGQTFDSMGIPKAKGL